MTEQRLAMGLSQSRAAKLASVSRSSWIAWEKDTTTPEDYNHVRIETVLHWGPGSVASVLAGGVPTIRIESDPLKDPDYLAWRAKFQELSARYGRDEALRLLDADESTGQNIDKRSLRRDAG
jgi:transcriptional regulator with XRE-family HTH domain